MTKAESPYRVRHDGEVRIEVPRPIPAVLTEHYVSLDSRETYVWPERDGTAWLPVLVVFEGDQPVSAWLPQQWGGGPIELTPAELDDAQREWDGPYEKERYL